MRNLTKKEYAKIHDIQRDGIQWYSQKKKKKVKGSFACLIHKIMISS